MTTARGNRGWAAVMVAAILMMLAAAIATPAQTFTTLHTFDGGGDGDIPSTALIQATDGSLYGTTYGGGANSFGTVFKIAPSGALTTLYSFCSPVSCMNGELPSGGYRREYLQNGPSPRFFRPELICFGFARDESLAPPMSPRDTTSPLRSDSRFAGCRRRCR
jgi:uncharacterized repeat protein (TIGR03803 family)